MKLLHIITEYKSQDVPCSFPYLFLRFLVLYIWSILPHKHAGFKKSDWLRIHYDLIYIQKSFWVVL